MSLVKFPDTYSNSACAFHHYTYDLASKAMDRRPQGTSEQIKQIVAHMNVMFDFYRDSRRLETACRLLLHMTSPKGRSHDNEQQQLSSNPTDRGV